MRFSKTKKIAVVGVAMLTALLLVCHYRVSFVKQSFGKWSVGYGHAKTFPNVMPVDKNRVFSLSKLKQSESSTEFLADPFFVKEKDTFYIFFEHKHLNYHPAEIGVLISSDGQNYTYGGSVLREKFHLSYPQVFKHKGEYYMVPESQAANNVLIYKAERFPYDWKVCDTLLDNVKFKDPTLYISDSLNIMAVTDKDLNMYLYRADSLFGKWTLHQRGKVLMGGESRPGGRFINDGHGLILPVQNSEKGYGTGLSLYRLTFKNGSYSVKKEKHLYLKGQPDIPEFEAGMHQLDLQFVDGQYYFVYDGISFGNKGKKFEIYPAIKTNFFDLKNWIYQQLH